MPRLSLAEWKAECDRMALCGYIFENMLSATDANGDRLFGQDAVGLVLRRATEGQLVIIIHCVEF